MSLSSTCIISSGLLGSLTSITGGLPSPGLISLVLIHIFSSPLSSSK
nr:MAG TPA: hypothetical protein [Crassvirales sp.]